MRASISTPVCAVVSADARISTPSGSRAARRATCESGSGWQSGISSDVRFAAMIPASCAVASASPFGSARRRAAVSGAMCTTARATARRRCDGLPPTSTIFTDPLSSTWESSVIAGRLRSPGAGRSARRPAIQCARSCSRTWARSPSARRRRSAAPSRAPRAAPVPAPRRRTGSRRAPTPPSSAYAPAFSESTSTPSRSLTSGPSLATRFSPSETGLTSSTSYCL